ncbi:MAG: RNA polymerase sigma factor SigZ [Anaerolineae bacterium]|nr:RNA polymerase sigma factor SigZ [Anaerolineae bacterium]
MTLTTDAVWSDFSQRLGALIRSKVADPADADDILQDVFLKVHLRLDTLQDESRLAPWLYQITRNAITDYYRSRRQTIELQESYPAESAADQTTAEQQLAGGLQEMIGSLPATYQEALILAEINGLSQKDVADRLDLSYSGAKSRVQRGRRLLREALVNCCHIELDRRGGIIDYVPRDQLCRQCCA